MNWNYFPFFRFYYFTRLVHWDLLWPIAIIVIGVLVIYFVIKKEKEVTDSARGKPKASPERKILRSSENKMLGGVCAGVADYLKIDVTFIRLGWVIFTVYTVIAVGVLAYLAMLILIPQEE